MKNIGRHSRSIVLTAMMLVLCFGIYASRQGGYMVQYGLLLPLGLLLAVRNFSEKENRSSAPFRWAAASSAVCFVALTVSGMSSSQWQEQVFLIWNMAVYSLFVLFVPRSTKASEVRSEFMLMSQLFICLYLPFALVALASVFTGRVINLPVWNGAIGIQKAGKVGDRIWIFMHPNGTAQYAMLAIMFALYVIMNHRNRAAKVFYAFNILVNLLVLAHAQSRTANIALGGALGLIAFRAIWLCPKLRAKGLRVAAGMLAAVVVLLVTMEGVNWVYKFDVGLVTEDKASNVVSRIAASNQDDLSGRDVIWGNSIEYIMNHPETLIAGMGLDRMETIGEEQEIIQKYGSMHNSFLEVLAMCGLPMLICIIGLLCSLFCPALRVWLAPKENGMRGMFLFPVVAAMLLAISLTESAMFINPRQVNFFLYLAFGYILQCDALMKRGEIQKEYPHEN